MQLLAKPFPTLQGILLESYLVSIVVPHSHKIADVPSPKKFSAPKFNIYNDRTDHADHVKYYQQVMAY